MAARQTQGPSAPAGLDRGWAAQVALGALWSRIGWVAEAASCMLCARHRWKPRVGAPTGVEAPWHAVGVSSGVSVGVFSGVLVSVAVGVSSGVAVKVAVGVSSGVWVGVDVGVSIGVSVGVAVSTPAAAGAVPQHAAITNDTNTLRTK